LQDAEEAERRDKMNGAESLVRTLVGGGVEVCFANPGTSEMHFVAALDRVDGMRCVLGLFEGVVTGAADGYYRMSDKPAATLLHLGPGLPDIDWVGLAKSLGVPGARVADMDGFNRRFAEGLATPGPYLVEVFSRSRSTVRCKSRPTEAGVRSNGTQFSSNRRTENH
jgi:thiamine pyrophosphate-dependent acetolactate synthase large subunit-like protein